MVNYVQETDRKPTHTAALIALNKWRKDVGVSSVTVWRWRRDGWLKTVNLAGRPYVTAEAGANFYRRAEAGEFAKKHVAPNKRTKGGAL